jgi:uncharacterized repeat protein (TIGR01451 family)
MANAWRRFFCFLTVFLLTCFIFIHPAVSDESANTEIPLNQYGIRSTNSHVVDRFIENGKTIDRIIVPGPPRPPAGVARAQVANLPVPSIAAGTNTLANVPAIYWAFGCSATSAAMMFGHYDNAGYPNMYTGPTNGGVFPMSNAVWGTHDFGNGDGPMALCPLSATRNGLDSRTINGHVDDYWVSYESTDADPFIGNWTEHTKGECTGDYMGTNQSSFHNTDGSTSFWYYTDGSPLYDYIPADSTYRDGNHGLKLFVESRGYSVQTNGNFYQLIQGQGSDLSKGFTYANFKTEIDAGRSVLIQLDGHTMLGYGYNDPSTIYVHDTWDYNAHSMTWGGTYGGMQHIGVTVLRLTGGSADMGITITGSSSSVIIGANITYTITTTNLGPNGTTNATVTDVLPSGVTFVSATPSQGSCNGTSTVTCNLGTMNNGSTATISLVVTTTAANAILTNTASVTSDFTDSNATNNTATAHTVVNNPVPVISSLSPSSATPGGASFTLTVYGSNFVNGAQIKWNSDTLTTTFVSATQLTAAIPASDILTAGTANVTVVNPTPGGGPSSTSSTFTITTPPAGGDGGGGGGCFIATVAFGSPLEKHVQILRDFRDRVLLNSVAGKAFVDFYYRTSPPIAGKIAQSEGLCLITRVLLMPVIGVAYLIVQLGMFMTMMLFTITLLTVILTIAMLRKKIRKSARAKAAA